MKQTTIAECKEKVGEVIPSVSGIITKVFPRKTGESVKNGKKFPWSIQNGEISDDSGLIRFTVFGASDEMPQDWRGQEVTFLSTQGRGGLTGVSVQQNEYQGKTYVELKIDKTAQIIQGTPKASFEEPVKSLNSSPGSPTNGLEPHNLIPLPKANQNKPQVNVDDFMLKYRTLYQKCLISASQVELEDEKNLSTSDVKDIASCFFIQAVKSGLLDHIEVNEEVTEAF